jgi:hypothetical protein
MKLYVVIGAVILAAVVAVAVAAPAKRFFIAPLYIEYSLSSDAEFAKEVRELRERIGESSGVQVGFSAFLNVRLNQVSLSRPLDAGAMEPTLSELRLIVNRARTSRLPVHVAIATGFFHGQNRLREEAIRADVRNAQWFSDGSIADPAESVPRGREIPTTAWLTPSRYAQPLRQRIQEGMELLGKTLAAAMEQNPDTLLNVSGDTEVEFSFARHLDPDGRARSAGQVFLADYSPFMVAEFRDWLRNSRYARDASPDTDDDHDGHTLNKDFRQEFRTWQLRYFENSGPIPYAQYRAMTPKLPTSGTYFIDGGFDAPRVAASDSAFWKAWQEFRIRAITNYNRDFAEWITAGSRIPSARYYTHQIPADYLFGGRDAARLATSASPLETAFLPGLGSPGVTVFDTFNGRAHSKTSNTAMFKRLEQSGGNWGVVEYSPSVPAIGDENHYLRELRTLYSFHPAIIVPFAWTNAEQHKVYRIQNTAYERALRKFVEEVR